MGEIIQDYLGGSNHKVPSDKGRQKSQCQTGDVKIDQALLALQVGKQVSNQGVWALLQNLCKGRKVVSPGASRKRNSPADILILSP